MVNALALGPVILLVVLSSPTTAFSQDVRPVPDPRGGVRTLALRPPPPDGQRIIASDGDTVVLEGDARVRVVRRQPAFVRMVADPERRFVVVIVEHLAANGDTPTRLSDKAYSFHSVEGQWPFSPRWEGSAWLEEEISFEGFGLAGLGIETPQGAVFFGRRGPYGDLPPAQERVTLSFMGFGTGGGKRPFDEAERQQVANAVQSAARDGVIMQESAIGSGSVSFSSEIVRGGFGQPPPQSTPNGAVRVGGNVAPPQKIRHVEPQPSGEARAARVSGVVILEITIGIDGSVSDARILRSIPLLDQEALRAVRQWKYAPPTVNGSPVPVITTAPVYFR